MPLYRIETHGELHPFLSQEWLLTNGLGSFASSTIVGCNSRRYHGLLCAATVPPVARVMALNRVGELVFLDGRGDFLELSINHFHSSLHPRGEKHLRRFELGRTARWEFDVDGVRITKELQLAWMRNAIGLRYSIEPEGEREVELHLLPFVSLRDFHSLLQAQGTQYEVTAEAQRLSIARGDQRLHLQTDAGHFMQRSDWWYGHEYPIEAERGLDHTEDLFVPGALLFKARGKATVTLWASMQEPEVLEWEEQVARRPDPAAGFAAPSTTFRRLARAAADFVVFRRRPDGKPGTSIIAGYPWFADWGRDTMIALPGLLLATGRHQEAGEVLTLFAEYVSEGMIPNRFEDYTNEPTYNTVDASLWFVHACFEYLRATNDAATFNSILLHACRAIIKGHRAGTRFGIRMDPADGLIVAGDASTQLTWMDAKCEGVAFTPRHGKAIEINALWYHALRLLGEDALAEKVGESFRRTFWLSPFRGCYDVVSEERKDASIRPNQIFAVSLPHSPLDEEQQRAVVEVVRRELLTPYGLRTLAKGDPNYHGRYVGPPFQRDSAYHNGTVWGWLIGPFLDAYMKTHGDSVDAVRQCRVWLQPLLDHMQSACIGQISEIFEADEPHRAVGCPAQAWSVAEVLRLAVKLGM